MAVIERVLREFEPEAVERDVERIRAELQALERELANLTRAIAVGGELEPLLAELSARQDRHRGLRAKLADWEAGSIRRLDRQVIEGKVRTYLEHWRGLLTSHVQDGRQSPRECSQVR